MERATRETLFLRFLAPELNLNLLFVPAAPPPPERLVAFSEAPSLVGMTDRWGGVLFCFVSAFRCFSVRKVMCGPLRAQDSASETLSRDLYLRREGAFFFPL